MPSNEVAPALPSNTVEATETTSQEGGSEAPAAPLLRVVPPPANPKPQRRYMQSQRPGINRKFEIPYIDDNNIAQMFELYVTVNTFDDGTPGEVFLKVGKPGDMLRGAMDQLGTMISLLLQHGVPLSQITEKFRHMRCGPSGLTGIPEFRTCSSPFDLLAQWLDKRFGPKSEANAGVQGKSPNP